LQAVFFASDRFPGVGRTIHRNLQTIARFPLAFGRRSPLVVV
jgi:hypothetical protein